MRAIAAGSCESCGRPRRPEDLVCPLCGALSARATRRRVRAPAYAPHAAPQVRPEERDGPRLALPAGAGFLAAGVPLALALGFLPIAQYMGWFLASLVHEMGHAAAAWACGMPAVPAIRLDGHAAAVHGEQLEWLCLGAIGLLAYLAFQVEGRVARVAILVAALVVYPAVAYTEARDVLHLAAGHGAELAFATLALWRAVTGGFTQSAAERALYAGVGWYLLGSNVALTAGLMTSDLARADYASNGSFGLTNDYLRLAQDHLGLPLEAVAAGMTVPALAVLPLALLLAALSGRHRAPPATQRATDA